MVAEQIAARRAGLNLDQIRPSPQLPPRPRHDDALRRMTVDNVSRLQSSDQSDSANEKPLTQRFYYIMQQKHGHIPSPSSLQVSVAAKRPSVPPKAINVLKSNHIAPNLPPRPASFQVDDLPPPIPSRVPSHSCLWCRDFSGVDAHATLFPRENIRSPNDLAHVLTAPFPSVTDKARAIYTWLHHNIAYNTEAFFSGNLKPATPDGTLKSGLAVCEGYAGLFADLAAKSGFTAKVVSGFGKGYGYVHPIGSKFPTFESNHAWNAVKLENGKWHLIDPCWGAGHVGPGSRAYVKQFNSFFFCSSVEEFGQSHFPSNQDLQFMGTPRSWDEFIGIPESPIITRNVAGLYVPIQQPTPHVKTISCGRTDFRIQWACPKAAVECLLVIMGPGGKVTEMTRQDDGWSCTADTVPGRWMCGIPTEEDETRIVLSLKDFRGRYMVRGICVWECVDSRVS